MEFNQEFKVPTNIHHMIMTPSAAGFVDNEGAIRLIDASNGKPRGIQSLGAQVDYAYFRGNASRGDFLSIYFPKDIKTALYQFDKTENKYKKKADLSWSVAATEVAEFSNDSSLLAVGGNDGQVCIYRTDNATLVTIPPRCNEYISATSFNGDNSLIAYASFKKNLTIYDLDRFATLSDFLYKEVVCALKFLHKSSLLVVGARDNRVFLFDAISGYMVRELVVTINWPVSIYVDEDDQFCFVSDKAGYLYMIDLGAIEQEKDPAYNSKTVIIDIKRRGETIYFAFEDGRVTFIDLGAERDRLKEFIDARDMNAMYEMIRADPIMKYSAAGMMHNLDGQFEERFAKAVLNIAQNQIEAARSDMGDLLTYPIYQKRFDATVRHASKVVTFWQLMQSGQYQEAYSLANEGDFYKKLPLYNMLETRFKERFTEGVANLNGDQPDPKKTREDLLLYLKVPIKEAVIKNMLKNPEIFKRAQNAYDRKDWIDLAGLIDKFKMLKGAPVVTAYQEMIQREEELFLGLMAAGRYDEAFEPAKFLKENSKIDAVSLKIEFDKLEIVEKFSEIVKSKQYGLAMKTAIENPFLITSNAYKTLDQMLSIRFKAAHLYATQNRFDAVDKMLRPFLKNPFSSNRAIGTYKTLYLQQIDSLGAKMQEKHWINALKNYVCRFGVDSEIELLCRKYDRDRTLDPFREFKSPNFLRFPLVPNIVTTPFAKPQPKAPTA